MRILIAGIGNIFYGDDYWGPCMTGILKLCEFPDDVTVTDFGIRGLDLAMELSGGVDIAILMDVVQRGGAPGTLYLIEPTITAGAPAEFDGHTLDPEAMLNTVALLGAMPSIVRIVGCEPANLVGSGPDAETGDEYPVGLSDAVAAAMTPAMTMIVDLVATLRAQFEASCTS